MQGGCSPIAAPEVVSKFDPPYPGDLMQDGVQGTVILTATIRADGSVGDIAVAKSLDPRLDQNASEAFSHWLFRPAIKDGRAIESRSGNHGSLPSQSCRAPLRRDWL